MKKFLTLLMTALLILSFAVPAMAESKTITTLSSNGGEAQLEFDKYINDKFHEMYPDYTAEISYVSDPLALIRQQLAAGVGTDLILTDVSSIALYASAGYLLPLDEYAEEYGWEDRFVSWAYDNCKIDGKLMGLPGKAQGLFMFYNKAMFEENGWTVPETADEFYDLCAKISEAGILPITFGTADYKQCNEHWISMVYNSYLGAETMRDLLSGKQPWTIPEVGEATQILVDLYSNGWLCNDFPVITSSDALSLFATERAAMQMCGTWLTESLVNFPDLEWDYFVLPALSGKETKVLPISTNGAFALNASSEVDPDVLAAYLNWNYDADLCAEAMVKLNALYPLKDIEVDPSQLDARMIRISDDLNLVGDVYEIGYNPWTFWPTSVETAAWSNIESVLFGEMTIEQYQELLQQGMDEDIANGRQKSF